MTVTETQLANLKKFQPGQSGNPAGRPKNEPLISPAMRRFAQMPLEELRAMMDRAKDGDIPAGLTVAEGIALLMLKKALTNEAWGDETRKTLLERIDGAPPKTDIEVSVGVVVNLKWDNG